MGRFLGGSPSDSENTRRGRRYEALPANGGEDDEDHEDRESLGTEAASPTIDAPVAAAAVNANPAASPSIATTTTAAARESVRGGDGEHERATVELNAEQQTSPRQERQHQQQQTPKQNTETKENNQEDAVSITINGASLQRYDCLYASGRVYAF